MICGSCSAISNSLLSQFSVQDRSFLDRGRVMRQFAKREPVFTEGEQPRGIYCVAAGSLKLYKSGPNGHEQILRIVHAGELLGYRALFANEPMSASAEAREETSCCFFEKRLFLELIRQSKEVAMTLIAQLSKELRRSREQLLERTDHHAEARLARSLLDLGQNTGSVRIARIEMASLIGTTPETVSRILQRFKQNKLIALKGREIVIKDREKLTENAEVSTDSI